VPPALGRAGSSAGSVGTALWHSPRHPPGPKPKVPGEQRWQRRPMTLGLQWHCPPWGRHSALSEPWGSQRQAAGRERGERRPPWGMGRGMGRGAVLTQRPVMQDS